MDMGKPGLLVATGRKPKKPNPLRKQSFVAALRRSISVKVIAARRVKQGFYAKGVSHRFACVRHTFVRRQKYAKASFVETSASGCAGRFDF